jgi:hypothetical protein
LHDARTQALNQEVKSHLSNVKDDIPLYDPIMGNSNKDGATDNKKSSKPKWALEEVERWTMVKRIF